ncbi:hypothetical protein ACFL51_01620, partial [Myxococcota bacterium]
TWDDIVLALCFTVIVAVAIEVLAMRSGIDGADALLLATMRTICPGLAMVYEPVLAPAISDFAS